VYSVRLFDTTPASFLSGVMMGKSTQSLQGSSADLAGRKSLSFAISTSSPICVTSHFCARLALNQDGGLQSGTLLANHGRLFESAQVKWEAQSFVGLEFSLNGTTGY
jgi:hypothetical protein